MVHEPLADGAALVRSPIHMYVHFVHEPFANGLVQSVYQPLDALHSTDALKYQNMSLDISLLFMSIRTKFSVHQATAIPESD